MSKEGIFKLTLLFAQLHFLELIEQNWQDLIVSQLHARLTQYDKH